MTLRVLDLFAGTGSATAAFRERGHDVTTVDLDPAFGCDMTADVLALDAADLAGPWDFIWASPPCTAFSLAAVYRHWPNGEPGPDARLGIALVEKTIGLVRTLKPRAWMMENPVGMLRTLPVVAGLERRTITYCQYGDVAMKPTDLWGGFPPTWRPRARCSPGDPCHEPAPRGSGAGGTQGKSGAAERAMLPYGLALNVALAMENWRPGEVPAGRTRLGVVA